MFADQKTNLSICRDERIIYIYRAEGFFQSEEAKSSGLKKKLESKIGGAFGFGANLMTANITLEKEVFEPGEEINIKFEIDNRACSQDVKSYKVKLMRDLVIYENKKK